MEQARRELRAEREEQATDRPRRDDGERGQEERPPHLPGHARPLRRQPHPPARADRLGHRQRPDECDREQREQHDVREHARRREQLDRGGGHEHSEPEPAGAHHAVREADGRRVAAWVQVEHRGARSAEREARREPLQPARHEQPDDRVGEHEDDAGHHQAAERDEQDGPAADLVGQAAGEDQAREHAERVRAVDEREDERGEAPELAVDPVERRRRDRREQRETHDGGHERVGERRRERAAAERGGGGGSECGGHGSFHTSNDLEL